MKAKSELSPLLSGVAGEYFVAAELSKRGYLASITLRNTKGVDILCSNADASKSVGIQVKTNKFSRRSWVLSKKAEDNSADSLFYVFVNLNLDDADKSPEYFIVPSRVVAKYTLDSHKKWLATPGKNGVKHNDSTMRHFIDEEEKYKDQWKLLGLELN